tara:strand:+ start:139 stop:753 length:615 start_codon:yes stop_codon:yes gene_type:complete
MTTHKKNNFFDNCSFVKGVANIEGLEFSDIPEIAFLGRSNVGKSSLLNAITKRSKLAHTSKTPGRTQELNFFSIIIDRPIINIVDMPGYGFAKASKKKIREWTDLSKFYLQNRPNLRRVFLLIDSRHNIKDSDKKIMSMLDDCAVSYQIVLTKIDKINNHDDVILETKNSIQKFIAVHPEIHLTSSHKEQGLEDLRNAISSMVE